MTRLALRQLRPYILIAVVLAAAATAGLFSAAAVVQRQLDAADLPDCRDPNLCWPTGSAMDAILGIQLIAALTPLLLGVVLAVGLAASNRADEEAAELSSPAARGRRLLVTLGLALAVGVVCAGTVAVTHRLVTAPLTVLANDRYELLELTHLNHPGFMTAQTAVVIALAAWAGRRTARPLRAVAVAVAGLPAAILTAYLGAALLVAPFRAALDDRPTAADGSFADDYAIADGTGWALTALLSLGVVLVVLLTRRSATRTDEVVSGR